jgi:rhodanese-related sulfurtransferase
MVDSRTGIEYERGTIQGARHLPVTDLPEGLARMDLDPEEPVVFLCMSGHRSRPGTRLLRGQGREAYSLRGGMAAWKRAGLPLEKQDD